MNVMRREAGVLTRARIFALIAMMCLWGVQAMAADGLTTIRSSYGPKYTMIRLEAEVKAKGLTVFARIDHEAGAAIISGQNKLDIKIRTAAFPISDASGYRGHPLVRRLWKVERGGISSRLCRRLASRQGACPIRCSGAIQADVACGQDDQCGMAFQAELVRRVDGRPDD
jgi:hypothetical protein